MTQHKLKIGVLGASRIVRAAMVDAAKGLAEVSAVAARDEERARLFADDHGIARSFGSYEALLEDDAIDAVYIALPASAHAPWTLEALARGKHVLCEKPFGLDVEEARRCVDAARDAGLVLMEGHHWRYHPLVAPAELALGGIGKLDRVEATFHGGLNNSGDIRLNPELGPGVLMDFGCYTIQWVAWAAGVMNRADEVEIVTAEMVEDPPGVDRAARVELRLGGVVASFSCDMRADTPYRSCVTATGSLGEMHFEGPLAVEGSHLSTSVQGGLVPKEPKRIEPSPATTTYREQLKVFLSAISEGSQPLTSGENIIFTQQLLDSIYEKAGVISRKKLRAQALRA